MVEREGVHALDCQWAAIETVLNTSQMPVEWTNGKKTCDFGDGCQDTLMLIENGPQVNLVLTKGCTSEKDHEVQVTEHRTGPGLSVISYTHVCRHRDLCNDLSTSVPLWSLHTEKVLGTLQCPVCFSRYNCPEKASQQFCPVGQTHCYNGVLKLRGGGIATNLKVQGCMPKPGCDLLNGTQKIGPIAVSENCNPKSGAQALECKWGAIEAVRNVSELPLQWTTGWESCAQGQGCQETVILVVNGPLVNVVLTKGCTEAEDQEGRVSEHRKGPGLTIISYTRVCRHKDFCNDLSSTDAFWTLPPAAVLGTLQCPVCFSRYNCPEKASQQFCPVGQTHCYNGVLKLRGGGIATNLKVQGCLPKPGCDLLNGTQKIGPIAVSENCNPKSDTLTCNRGVMLQMGRKLAQDPVEWTSSTNQMCDPEEVCQETLMLIDVGHRSLLMGSKGCSKAGAQNSQAVSLHSRPPGVLVASYVRVCSSDLCNNAGSSSVLLTSLPKPAAPAPGGLQCPACVQFPGSCSQSSNLVTCPSGVTHCYDGNIAVNGGGLSTTLSIQGCMAPASKYLLNHTRNVGIFSVRENFEDDNKEQSRVSQSGVARATYLLWVMGMGLFLALWNGGLYPLC
ncbi:CD177 antigen isoform X2 [Marmota flaviventris]|uniref:CD177 antigen isoform X2 n=1 Tax=Marmota flaviventris TaxID=93162 RepID=UPI003A85596C